MIRPPSLFLAAVCALALSACTETRLLGEVSTDGGTDAGAPIRVLVWNNALAYGHAARVEGLPYLTAREATDHLAFDLTYAHLGTGFNDGPSDTTFDASAFTDAGLDKYDVILFFHTTGKTLDDDQASVHRQALRDFIEKKGRGFVGVHSATDTYQDSSWPWYLDFIGTNYDTASPIGIRGTAQLAGGAAAHPIMQAARLPNPWTRNDEWFVFTRDPLTTAIPGLALLLTAHDDKLTNERPSAWVHEMPPDPAAPRAGRMFYTACCHQTVTFKEPAVIDFIIAGIKWAAYRL